MVVVPSQGVFEDQLPLFCDVELRRSESGLFTFWVGIFNGEESIIFTEKNDPAQEGRLQRLASDTAARRQGKRIRLEMRNSPPIYFKSKYALAQFLKEKDVKHWTETPIAPPP